MKNTLSDNGGVTRGICKMDEKNNLTKVVETKNIVKTTDGAEYSGWFYISCPVIWKSLFRSVFVHIES